MARCLPTSIQSIPVESYDSPHTTRSIDAAALLEPPLVDDSHHRDVGADA